AEDFRRLLGSPVSEYRANARPPARRRRRPCVDQHARDAGQGRAAHPGSGSHSAPAVGRGICVSPFRKMMQKDEEQDCGTDLSRSGEAGTMGRATGLSVPALPGTRFLAKPAEGTEGKTGTKNTDNALVPGFSASSARAPLHLFRCLTGLLFDQTEPLVIP